jgi:hypothetical protein
MDVATRRVFDACMSTSSNRPFSDLSLYSGAVFLLAGICTPIFESGVFLTISLWSAPVLLVALVIDVCHKRYWALVPLALLVAALGFFVVLLLSVDIPVGG